MLDCRVYTVVSSEFPEDYCSSPLLLPTTTMIAPSDVAICVSNEMQRAVRIVRRSSKLVWFGCAYCMQKTSKFSNIASVLREPICVASIPSCWPVRRRKHRQHLEAARHGSVQNFPKLCVRLWTSTVVWHDRSSSGKQTTAL